MKSNCLEKRVTTNGRTSAGQMILLSMTVFLHGFAIAEPLLDASFPLNIPYPFVCGRLAVSRVGLGEGLSFKRVACASVEAFQTLDFTLPAGAHVEREEVYTNHVIRHLKEADGNETTLTFFAAREHPWLVLYINRGQLPAGAPPLEMDVELEPSLDYLHKFAGTGSQYYQVGENQISFTCSDHPELLAVFNTSGMVIVNSQYPKIINATPCYPYGGDWNVTNIIDGNVGTEYASTNSVPSDDTFVDFDFGVSREFTGFKHIDRNNSELINTANLLFSDSADFSDSKSIIEVDHVGVAGGITKLTFESPVTARYVRWDVTNAISEYNVSGGAEIEFYPEQENISSAMAEVSGPVNNKILFTVVMDDAEGYVVLSAGDQTMVKDTLSVLSLNEIKTEAAAVKEAEDRAIESGAQLRTPDINLNRFFNLSKIWFHKAVRKMPFGWPYSVDTSNNQEVEVLTASPDYQGVFANDTIQTSLEGMLVAPELKQTYIQGLKVMLGHAVNCSDHIPESVEMISGDESISYSSLRIGQHPEWIISAASLVLLSGDQALGEDLWPGVELALNYFIDQNEDGVGEWDINSYPEHLNTTNYQSGMLYAQAWWAEAFKLCSEMAYFLGKKAEGDQLQIRSVAVTSALETKFGRVDGYGSWLSSNGTLHPFKGHNQILPLAFGLADVDRAAAVVKTLMGPDMWVEPLGIIHSSECPGMWIWGFQRWNFVQAMFNSGQMDIGKKYATMWALSELSNGLPTPELLPIVNTTSGHTGQGYVWTAGRSIRALSYGLFGLDLAADGIKISPHLPSEWDNMSLTNIPLRNVRLTVNVKKGHFSVATLNGQPWTGPMVYYTDLTQEDNILNITVQEHIADPKKRK